MNTKGNEVTSLNLSTGEKFLVFLWLSLFAMFIIMQFTSTIRSNQPNFIVYENENMVFELNDSLIQEAGYRGEKERSLIVSEAIFKNRTNNNKAVYNIYIKKEDCFNKKGVLSYTYGNGEIFRDIEFDFEQTTFTAETIAAGRMCLIFNSRNR
ncbi:hypothetical protein H0A66_05970 [Alcaligenaceae bacterium]|nr:hypothetical protein [Alcaligenaceae bacterium]